MTKGRFLCKTEHIGITTVLMTVVMLILLSASCSRDKKDVVEVVYDPETTYTLKTTDVYTLISDSGLVKYRVLADEWYDFGNATDPYWYFPEGFYFEKFDTLFQVEASVQADTVYNWTKRSLWKLIGNVELVNLGGDSIQTSLMFWDQNAKRIYSDEYVRIVRADGNIITGIGFETTEQMSKYDIFEAAAEIMVDESEEDSGEPDPNSSDSTIVIPRSPSTRRPTPPPHNPMRMMPSRNRELPMSDTLHLDIIEETQRLIEADELQMEKIDISEFLETLENDSLLVE